MGLPPGLLLRQSLRIPPPAPPQPFHYGVSCRRWLRAVCWTPSHVHHLVMGLSPGLVHMLRQSLRIPPPAPPQPFHYGVSCRRWLRAVCWTPSYVHHLAMGLPPGLVHMLRQSLRIPPPAPPQPFHYGVSCRRWLRAVCWTPSHHLAMGLPLCSGRVWGYLLQLPLTMVWAAGGDWEHTWGEKIARGGCGLCVYGYLYAPHSYASHSLCMMKQFAVPFCVFARLVLFHKWTLICYKWLLYIVDHDTLFYLQLLTSCNDGVRLMECTEQLYAIHRKLDFAKLEPLPLVSASRQLVRCGVLLRLQVQHKLLGKLCIKKKPLYLFLFTDYVIVTKRKKE